MRGAVHNSTLRTIHTGMFSAVIAVLAQIIIPLPSGVPLSLQTFAVALTGVVLGIKSGCFSVLIYVLLGTVGIPVFTGFTAGIGILFGITGGFIWGFLFLCLFCGLSSDCESKIFRILFAATGLLLCHLAGVIQFSIVTETSLLESVLMVSLPYLPKDLVSVFLAYPAGRRIRRQLHYL